MRLPNGFGRITKIHSQKLRKPYRVMVTTGKDEYGRPIGKILKPEGYFKTYNEAYVALVKYHENPYDLDEMITMQELYDRWSEEHFKTLTGKDTARIIALAWSKASSIQNMLVRDVRIKHIKNCIDTADTTDVIKKRLKQSLNQMFDYALTYDLTEKNYARELKLNLSIEHKSHTAFSQEELNKLWENITLPYVDVLLIQCYSGWRPQEICSIPLENVDLDQNIIIGGMKTEAGKNRTVPIHPCIRDLVIARYKEAKKYNHDRLIKLTYPTYRRKIEWLVDKLDLNPNHKPHDGRKTFVTLAKKYGVDEYAIKYIVGHKITDLTERVYTERTNEWLYHEVCKIRP